MSDANDNLSGDSNSTNNDNDNSYENPTSETDDGDDAFSNSNQSWIEAEDEDDFNIGSEEPSDDNNAAEEDIADRASDFNLSGDVLFSDADTEEVCSCSTEPVDVIELSDPSMSWEENSSSLEDGNQSGTESDYIEQRFIAAAQTVAAANCADNAEGNDSIASASPTNDVNLNLRPVPASIDLTRNLASNDWQEYHAHVRASTRRLPFPDMRNLQETPAVVSRLCGGQPNRPCIVPVGIDPDFGGIVYIRNDSDTEEEPPLPPFALVPRRGNSVSDLSQCSSEEETIEKTE